MTYQIAHSGITWGYDAWGYDVAQVGYNLIGGVIEAMKPKARSRCGQQVGPT